MTGFWLAQLAWLLAGVPQGSSAGQQAGIQNVECRHPDDPSKDDSLARAARASACRDQIRLDPHRADAYLVLAMAVYNDSIAMLEALEAGRRIAPNDHSLQFNAGLTLGRFGRFDDAIAALERAAALLPTDPDAYTQAGLIAAQAGQTERAVRLLTEATTRGSRDGHAWGYLARSEAALGRHADAVRHWDRAQRESGYRYIDAAGDREIYARSLAIAPEAHTTPSQAAPTVRLLAMLVVPIVLLSGLVPLILRWRRTQVPAPAMRLFLAIALVHFVLSVVLLILTVGASYGAHRGWPGIAIERPLILIGQLLLTPLILARSLLPRAWAPGFGFGWLLLNSLLWAGVGASLATLWRCRVRGAAA